MLCYQSRPGCHPVPPPHQICPAYPHILGGKTNQHTLCCAPQFESTVDVGLGAVLLVFQLQKASKL